MVSHGAELALDLVSLDPYIIPASELGSGKNIKDKDYAKLADSNIYLICEYPAMSFVPGSLKHHGERIAGEIAYRSVAGDRFSFEFGMNYPLEDDEVSLRISAYPHRLVESISTDGSVARVLPAHQVAMVLGSTLTGEAQLRRMKVLYVGKSYTDDGNRFALRRLESHQTLQRILAEASTQRPDSEIFTVTFRVQPSQLLENVGSEARQLGNSPLLDVVRKVMNRALEISLFEASLIRYFEPRYNSQLTKNFPTRRHSSLAPAYALGATAVAVELVVSYPLIEFFSDTVPPSSIHRIGIDLGTSAREGGFFAGLEPLLETGSGRIFRIPPT